MSETGLTIASIYVNSLTAKIDEIGLLVRDKDIDILGMNETTLDGNIIDITATEGYTIKHMDKIRQGGGVAPYIGDNNWFQVT